MALESFVIKTSCRVPYVTNTGHAARPTQIKFKKFKKGDIINGEMKHANNAPAFVLGKVDLQVTIGCVKKLVTKEISTGADGKTTVKDKTITAPPSHVDPYPKMKVSDAVIVGAIAGAIGVYFAEKKNIIKEPTPKNKVFGAVGGALIFGYLAYRIK